MPRGKKIIISPDGGSGSRTHRHLFMKEWAAALYKSKAWKDCRAAYIRSKGGLCERCLAKGLYVPGEIVHHKIYISPENVSQPDITLNHNNLELLCRECHAREHTDTNKRYDVDEYGRVIAPR